MVRITFVAALLSWGFVAGGEAWREFLDLPSLLITVGGTLGVTFVTFSWSRLRDLAELLRSLWVEKQPAREELVEELRRLARLYRLKGSRGLEGQEESIVDPFLRRGVGMLIDIRTEAEIREQLEGACCAVSGRYRAAEQILLTMGKLLPTFGLIGTLIGLVLLLRQMSGQDPETLTSSFALAIMTTLYGTLLANVVVLPLGAKLQSAEQERGSLMRVVLEWSVSLARGDAPAAVERKLNGFSASLQDSPTAGRPWRRRVLSWER